MYGESRPYDKLSAWSKELLEATMGKLHYSAKKPPRTDFARFLLYLEEHGVNGPDEIGIGHFGEYLRYTNKLYDDYIRQRKHLRLVAMFLAKLLETEIAGLLTKRQGTSSLVLLEDLPAVAENSLWRLRLPAKERLCPLKRITNSSVKKIIFFEHRVTALIVCAAIRATAAHFACFCF
jgi:hypothetical protein